MSEKDKTKVKPGILVNKEVWLKFKEIYEHPSEVLESVMKTMIETQNTTSYMATNVGTYNFVNAAEWNMQVNNNQISLTNSTNSSNTTFNVMTNYIKEEND